MAIGSIAGLLNFAKGISTPLDNSRVNKENKTATWDVPWDAGKDIVFNADETGLIKTSRYVRGEGSVECYQVTRGGETIYISASEGRFYDENLKRIYDPKSALSEGQRAALKKFNLKVIDEFKPEPAGADKRSFLLGLLNDGAAFLAGTTIADHLDKVNLTGEKE